MGRVVLGLMGWLLFAFAILAEPPTAPVPPTPTLDFGDVTVEGVWLRSVAIHQIIDPGTLHIEGPDEAAFRILSTSGEHRTVVHLGFEPEAARVHEATLVIGGEHAVAIPLRGVGLLDSRAEVVWPRI